MGAAHGVGIAPVGSRGCLFKLLIYVNVQRRPFEVCASQMQQRDDMFTAVTHDFEVISRSNPGEFRRIAALVRDYNKEALAFDGSPCKSGWSRFFYYIDYAYSFPGATPYIWLIHFKLSEIYASLAVMLSAYIGCSCAFLIGRRLVGSNIGGLLMLAGLILTTRFFPDRGISLQYNLLAFPLMYAGQVLAVPESGGSHRRIFSWKWGAALVLFGAISVITLFGLPVIIKMWALAVALLTAAVMVMQWNRRALIRAALVLIAVFAFRLPYYSFSGKLLRPVSGASWPDLDSAARAKVRFSGRLPQRRGGRIRIR